MEAERERTTKPITIGVLIDWTVDYYQQSLFNGILDFAREHDTQCICFEGGALNAPHDYEVQRNGLFDLVGSNNVDGLLVLAGSLSQFIGRDEFAAFCQRFHDLPIVSISLELPGVPSVLVDNRSGIRELIVHLIERHHARRFAFIKGPAGNQDARQRYETFVTTLTDAGISIDPRYIFQGNFLARSGNEAVESFCKGNLSVIDAIVAANDNMAVGALEEIARRAPESMGRIIVTGFDDLDVASYSRPPLTTVHLPLHEQGWMGAELLWRRLGGETVPVTTFLPTAPVIRQSCGCGISHTPEVDMSEAIGQPLITNPRYSRTLLAAPQPAVGLNIWKLSIRLIDSLRHGLKAGDEKGFIDGCRELGVQSVESGIEFSVFQTLLSSLWSARVDSRLDMASAAADACFQAVMNLGQLVKQNEREQLNSISQEDQSLQLMQELLFALDTDQQMKILAYWLPIMGVEHCYISLFQNERQRAHCHLGLRNGQRIDSSLEERAFSALRLVPDDFLIRPDRCSVIVKALRHIGFIVFKAEPTRFRLYAFLSDIIAGALQTSILFRELNDQKNGISQNLENMRLAMAGFIQTMSLTVETRDPYTAGHQNRVSDLARNIAQELHLSPEQIESIRMAGIVHDLGKIYVPSEILNRSGILDDIEFSMIKRHPQVAYDILKNVDFPWPIAEIVYQHHERLNGSGYPRGLTSETISLEAKILAVADVVEAMSSHRPYRGSLGTDQALTEISKNRGILYDPVVVDACLRLFSERGYAFKSDSIAPRRRDGQE